MAGAQRPDTFTHSPPGHWLRSSATFWWLCGLLKDRTVKRGSEGERVGWGGERQRGGGGREREREKERERVRQTDRQTDRQIDRQTDGQTDRQTQDI